MTPTLIPACPMALMKLVTSVWKVPERSETLVLVGNWRAQAGPLSRLSVQVRMNWRVPELSWQMVADGRGPR